MDKNIQKKLAESACRGDIDSFAKLYEHYYAMMVALAYSIVPDYNLAEDIAQQTFTVACEKIHTLRDKKKFASWICGICRNASLSSITKSKRKTISIENLNLASNEDTNNEQQKPVQQAILSLTQMYREVVILYYYNDMTYNQIRALLGIPLHSVKGRLRRAKKMIKKYLNDHNSERRPI